MMKKFTGAKSENNTVLTFLQVPPKIQWIAVMCVFILGLFVSTNVKAQYTQVPVTGFTADVVADGTTNVDATASTTDPVDGSGAGANFVFVTSTFRPSGVVSGACSAAAFPTSITSSNTTTNTGITYALQPAAGTNSLRVSNSAPADLTLVTGTSAASLYFVCLGGNGATNFTAKVNFSDATSETISSQAPDWCGGGATNKLPNATSPTVYYRIARTATTCNGATCQYLYEIQVNLSPSNYSKTITSISFTNTDLATKFLHILAVGKKAPCTAPADAATALTQGTTTTSSIQASWTAATSAPTGYLVIGYPTGATPVTPVTGTTYTAGQTIGTGRIIQQNATLSATAAGLSGGTAYDIYVYSYNSGATCGGPVYNTANVLTGTFSTNACGGLAPGTYSIGPTALASPLGFSSITEALTYINANGITGNVILELQATYNSSVETYPIVFPVNPCVSVSSALTIRPETGATALAITTSTGTGTINFNGATYVTIDGRPGGVGTTSQLSISNTVAGTNYAIQFINDASNNNVRYCTIQSRNTSTTSGTIVFGTTTGIAGNDNNNISFCNISDITSNPLNAIYASGTTTTTLQYNDNNIISNNNIFNFFSAGSSANGILIGGGNSGWTIGGNSFYQTTARNFTGANTHAAINISSTTAGVGFNVSNNFIGGNAPDAISGAGLAPGTTANYTITGTVATLFRGIIIGTAAAASSEVQGNTIRNFSFATSSGTTTLPGVFSGIHITGGLVNVGTSSGNTIGATTGNGSITITSTTTGSITTGIYGTSAAVLTVQNNNIGAISTSSAAGIGHEIQGINVGGAGNHVVSLNNIGSGATANSISSGTSGTTTATCNAYGILAPATSGTLTISSNNVRNITAFTAGATTLAGIYSSGTVTTLVMNNNTVSNIRSAGASGSVFGMRASTTIYTMNSNSISNLSFSANSGSTSSNIYGIYDLASPTGETLTGNEIFNLSLAGTSTNAANVIAGIYTNTAAGSKSWSLNIIHDFTFNNSSTGSATMYGIFSALSSPNIFRNKIYGITATNGAASFAYGINIISGSTVTVYNNIVGGLTALQSSLAPNPSVVGLYISGGTTVNAYYNTIHISGTSSGANFSSAGVYTTLAPTSLDFRNNIFSNNSVPAGTGKTSGFQRSGSGFTNFAATSNNNLYYGGPASASNLVFFDGTNSVQNIGAYKLLASPRDAAATSENLPFLSTTGSNTDFLHINTTIGTQAESGGIPVSGITNDYDNDTRNVSTPDIGADEFTGMSVTVATINSVSITPTGNLCVATPRTVTANVTAGGSDLNSVLLNYSFNGGSLVSVTMTGGTLTAGSTSTWTGTIPAATPTNASVSWNVTATDPYTTKLTAGTTYQDDPLAGATASITVSASPVCAGTASTLTAAVTNNNVVKTLGAGATTPSSYEGVLYNLYGGLKTQFLVKASELTAIGLAPGNITSLGLNFATAPVVNYQGFAINIAATSLTTMTSTLVNTGFVQVYTGTGTNGGYTPSLGINTFVFGTGGAASSFTWDGISNLIVQFCYSNNNSGGTGNSFAKTDAPGFTCGAYYRVDTQTPAVVCAATAGNGTFTSRPQLLFTGRGIFSGITTYTWNDGTSNIGTGNPFIVNPASNTTYTVTAGIASGCTVTSGPATVNVIALPAPPNGNNSTQCGTAVPGCFVTTGGGGAGFKWYSAQTGGTLLQTGGATYIGTISSTTHFWVSESNGSCESDRTDVLATVAPADAVQAIVDNNNVCLNTAIQLSATQTPLNPETPNTYIYTWTASPAAGSGIPTSTTGNPVSVTPTVAGTYTYTVTANDAAAGCTTTSTVVVTIKSLPVIASTTATPATICAGEIATLNGSGLPQYFNIPVTGFNHDVVANGIGAPGVSTSTTFDNSEYVLAASDWNYNGSCAALTNFMPVSGQVTGNATVVGGALTYILQPYTANNDLRVPATGSGIGSGTLTVTTPVNASKLYLLYSVGNGPLTSGITVTVNFTDATTQVFSGLTGLDWFDANNPAIENLGRVQRTLTTACVVTSNGGPRLFDLPLSLSAGNVNKLIQSITVQTTSGTATLNVMAVGGFRTSVPYNWSWNPGSLSGSSVVVNPSTTTTYTATATDPATTCSNTATVTVNVNSLPPAPSGNNGTDQCGTAITDASVSSNNITDPQSPAFFNWYSAPTGGTLLQSGTSTTYTTAISTTTTWWVAEVSANGCEGPRVEISTTVSDPDPITVDASPASICLNATTAISVTYTPNFNTFATFELTATGGTASGVTGTVSLTPNGTSTGTETITITPTATGTYTYTVTAFDPDKGCTSIGTVIVTVNPNPTISNASASPATVCAGVSSVLTAVTTAVGPGTSTSLGTATSLTSATSQPTAFCNRWPSYRMQTIYTAAELTAIGLYPGNITSMAFNITTLGDGATNSGFTVKIAHTAMSSFVGASNFTSTASGFTTVYPSQTYTHTASGLQTIPFSTPFLWDGTSNIIVEVQHNGANLTNNSVTRYTSTAVNMVAYTTTSAANTASFSTQRLNVVFGGQVFATGAGGYGWTWNPGNLVGNVQTVTPSSTTTYTATATFNGCTSNSAPVTVTVNQLPAAPSTNDPVSRCGLGSVTLTATGSGGTLNWYNVSSGGTSLQTGGTFTTNVTASTSFWVAETSAEGCEGPRSLVNVAVTAPPTLAITAGSATTFCGGSSVTLNGTTGSDPSYNTFTWSASPAVGAGLSSTSGSSIIVTPTVTGTYTITLNANDGAPGGCANMTTVVVTMNPNPIVSSVTATPSTVCSGGTVTLTGQPQYLSVPVTGYNVDAVANGVGSAASSTTGDLDNLHTLAAPDWNFDGSCAPIAFSMPASGTVPANSTVASGLVYNLPPYAGLNTLRIPASGTGITGSGTLTVTTPTNMQTIYLLYGAGNGPITSGITVTVTFTDATTQVFSNLTAKDWFSTVTPAISNLGRVNKTTTPACATTTTGGPQMFDMALALSAANYSKLVQSITINKTITTGIMSVFGVGMQTPPQAGIVNWSWNPGSLTGSSVTVNPTATTTYTATATNQSTGCSSSNTVTVTVAPVTATATATPATPVCAGTTVTLNAGAVGTAPLTYSWASTPAGTYPASSSINVTPAVTTTYTVTVTDGCTNTITSSVTVNVNPLPTANIQEGPGPISICSPATQTLTAVTEVATATYQWTLNGTNITTNGTGPTYTVTGVSTGTYRVVVTNTVNNCASAPSGGVVVTINPAQAAFNITPPTATICNGGNVVLNTNATTSGSGTIGTGTLANTSTSSTSPYKGWYGGHKTQHMYKVAELTTLGLSGGSSITAIAMTISAFTGPYTFNGFTIAMKNTTAGSLTSTPETGVTTVLTPANFTLSGTAPFVVSHTLTTPFVWDGTSNLVVEFCWNNGNAGGSSTNIGDVNYTSLTGQSIYFSADNNANVCTVASGWSTSVRRINMNFTYSKTPAIAWSPTTGLSPVSGTTVTASPNTTTTYTATATNSFGCTNTATVEVTVNPRPTGTISGSGTFCEGAANTSTDLTLTFTGTGPWNYTYTDGTTPVSGTAASSPHTVTVSPSSATPGVITYTLTALSDANCASISEDMTGAGSVTINPLATTPTATVTQPSCVLATGSITMTAPLGAGNSYTLDGTTTITYPTVTFSGVAPGPHTITVTNSFGCSAPASASVTVDPQPFAPGTPVITGVVNVCPYLGTATQQTYTAAVTGNGTFTYTWTLPPNVVLVAGGGTNSPNNFVTVTFNTGLSNPAQANKQIRVTASNQCGTSPIGVFYLATQAPVTPGPITGPTNVCTLIGTANTATYTINSVLAATGYSWSVPSNATFTSLNDTTIVVTFPAGFTGGVVSVAATNGCGSNAVRTLTIVNAPPSTPALIAGPTNVCANIAPGGVAATYSVTPVTYATSYTWTAPAGAVVTHPNGAGPNDNTITVLFPAGFTSGTITVTATNGCGTSGVRSLSVTKLNPSTPSVIDVIQTAFCGDAGGRVFTYTLASMPANATSVLWTIPTTGATIVNGQGTISLTVSYIDGAVNGAVTAQGVNNCGISSVRSTAVKLPACPTEFAGGNQNNGETGTVKGNTTLPTAEVKAMEVKIFPNPTVSDFKLEVLTSRTEVINVRVLDNLGKLYKSFKLMPHQVIALGAELKAGSYFIEVRQGTEVKTTKLIKF